MKNELLKLRKAIIVNKKSYAANKQYEAYQAAVKMLRKLDDKLIALGYNPLG